MLHFIYFHVCASMCETTENIPPRYLCKKRLVTRRQAQCIKMSVDGGGGRRDIPTFEKSRFVHVWKSWAKFLPSRVEEPRLWSQPAGTQVPATHCQQPGVTHLRHSRNTQFPETHCQQPCVTHLRYRSNTGSGHTLSATRCYTLKV